MGIEDVQTFTPKQYSGKIVFALYKLTFTFWLTFQDKNNLKVLN